MPTRQEQRSRESDKCEVGANRFIARGSLLLPDSRHPVPPAMTSGVTTLAAAERRQLRYIGTPRKDA
jgi:hypothetical protein